MSSDEFDKEAEREKLREKYAKEERSLATRRERREVKKEIADDKRRDAGWGTLLSWKALGGPHVSEEEVDEKMAGGE